MSIQTKNTLTLEQNDFLRNNMQASIPRQKLADIMGITIGKVNNHIRILRDEAKEKIPVSEIKFFDHADYEGIC